MSSNNSPLPPPPPGLAGSTQLVVRQRTDGALIATGSGTGPAGPVGSVVELSGHSGSILSCRFNPAGTYLATASKDKEIFLWETSGEHRNVATLPGHKNAIVDLAWSPDSANLHSACADITIATWDISTTTRIRRHVGHDGVINCLATSKRGDRILASGSDDGSVGLWDPRQKDAIGYLGYDNPVTAVAIAEAGNEVYSGSIDNVVAVWDTRKLDGPPVYKLHGHTDTVSSLEVSPDTQTLLSYSFDGTVRLWDVRPFGPQNRAVRTLDGASGAGVDMNLARATWSAGPTAFKVAAGCDDGTVVVWDSRSGKLLQKVPGHKGAVNDVRFLPGSDTCLASASSDGTVLYGPI